MHNAPILDSSFLNSDLLPPYTARVTLPLRRQRVHTWTCLGDPLTIAATRLIFGFHMRLLRLWEWLTFMPKETPFPQ